MIYKLDFTPLSPFASPPVTGFGSLADIVQFIPWQPSAWPEAPIDQKDFTLVLKRIFELSMLVEIHNVIEDAKARQGNVEHRGHVLIVSMLCALDAVSSYGYGARSGNQIPDFIRGHFPGAYRPFADVVLRLYRHATVHSWNLFQVAITAGNDQVSDQDGVISFGLLNFFEALKQGTEDFLVRLDADANLQRMARSRYTALKMSASPATVT